VAQFLFKRAVAPFLVALSEWVYKGIVSDHSSEFMIEERSLAAGSSSAATWETRFTVRAVIVFWFRSCLIM
jgi:hypothetical protein